MAELYRYAAFISYSSKDALFARRLHHALETYGIPSSLGTFDLIGGGKKNRIYPVFRDREELSAGHLGDLIEANLKASAALIVVCSPNCAASPWVQKEIEFFSGLGRRDRIFAIVTDASPVLDASGADATSACFPPAFRGDALAGDGLEPLAADARRGKDGFRNAWLKIVAGLIGISPGQLIDRDRRRRNTQRMGLAAAAMGASVFVGLGLAHFDARAWRTAMVVAARDYYLSGRTMDSLPLLIAGARPSGALIAIDGAQAREVIRRRPEAGLIRDFGQVAFTPEFSPNGSFLRVQTGSEDWLITDGAREIALPPLEVLPSFSPRDAKIAFSVTEGAFVVNLVDGRASRVGDAAQDVSFSADGSMLVLHISGQPARVVDIGTGAVRTVAASETPPAISPDGMWLAGWRSAMDAYAMNLETGATWRLGRFSSERTAFVFSPDSRFLATVGPNDIWQLMDLRTGREIRIGGFEGFGPRFTANSRWLVGIASPDRVFVLDLVSGQRHSFGVAVDIEPAPDGETIALMTGDDSRIVSLATRQARTLGHSLHSISFSADVTRLMALDASDNAYVYDLATGAVVRELGQTYAYPAFTVDGRRVAARTMDGVTYVVDLESGTRADLGFSMDTRSNGAELSSDGRLLAMWDRAGDGFVFDLDRIFAKLNRGVTVSDLCSGDAGALTRSFPPEIRGDENVAADADAARHRSALHRQLRGRPWNPCDWRGLGAILPDTERGGGWFEGLRQWWRLHLVRTGLAVDYACGEVNAAGATDPARLRGCAITPPSI